MQRIRLEALDEGKEGIDTLNGAIEEISGALDDISAAADKIAAAMGDTDKVEAAVKDMIKALNNANGEVKNIATAPRTTTTRPPSHRTI